MKLIIEGDEKEIAALILELSGRQGNDKDFAESAIDIDELRRRKVDYSAWRRPGRRG